MSMAIAMAIAMAIPGYTIVSQDKSVAKVCT